MVRKTLAVIVVVVALFILALAIITNTQPSTITYGNKIAVIKISGTISSSGSVIPSDYANPSTITALLDKAEKDSSVKAVVLEVNSPGGSAVASDTVAAKVKGMKKPTVAWISDIGTSGAYWVASSADKVVSHPLAVTCSIGAYSIVSDWSEFFEKLGMNYTVVKSGEFKDLGSMYKPLEPEEQEILQDMIDKVQDYFVKEIAANRNMNIHEVESIADGRPCIGKDALNYGLVDELGSKEDAIKLAKKLAGIEKAKTVTLQEKSSFASSIFGSTLKEAFYAMGIGVGHGLKDKENIEINS